MKTQATLGPKRCSLTSSSQTWRYETRLGLESLARSSTSIRTAGVRAGVAAAAAETRLTFL